MKYITLIMILSSVALAHSEDLYPDQTAIIKRMDYADNLEKNLKQLYKQASVSLFGEELEHILILSPFCAKIKNYSLTGARQLGIISATCRWFDGQQMIKIPR